MLYARRRLSAAMDEAPNSWLEKRAGIGLVESICRGMQTVSSDSLAGARIDCAPFRICQARGALDRFSNRDSLKPRDMHVDKMGVSAANARRRTTLTVFCRVFVIDLDKALI
jgi:hypothetical protein